MKLLAFDIETFPAEAYVWRTWQENIAPKQIIRPGEVACWSATFLGEDEMFFDSLHRNSSQTMHANLYALMKDSDAVVTYNGNRFDIPWVQTGFLMQGLPPLVFKQIDLYRVVRKNFKFPSYKLEYVVKALGIGEKMPNVGFELWKACMMGDKDAWVEMEEYCKHDTTLLEGLYERVLPYINNHPNRSLVEGLVCPACGGTNYKKDGVASKAGSLYQKYVCKDCGKPFRGTENLASKERFMPL